MPETITPGSPDTITAYSPVHHHLDHLGAKWTSINNRLIATQFGNPDHKNTLALCDLSNLPKVGFKGDRAESYLADAGIDVPTALFGFNSLPDGGLIVRSGNDEFFLEAGPTCESFNQLGDGQPGAYRLHRDDATFLITGKRVHEAMLQTCGINLPAQPDDRVIYTRIAGINTAICPQTSGDQRTYRIWLDYTSADYLWEELAMIIAELGGGPIGAEHFGVVVSE